VDQYVAMTATTEKIPPTTTAAGGVAQAQVMGGATDSSTNSATPKTQAGTGHPLKLKYTSCEE